MKGYPNKMIVQKREKTDQPVSEVRRGERGTATVTSLLVLALCTGFVALALSRVAMESRISGNDSINARTMYAAQSSLEVMTREFNKLFRKTFEPSNADLANLANTVNPNDNAYQMLNASTGNWDAYNEFSDFTFQQSIIKSGMVLGAQPIGGGEFTGLLAKRTPYTLLTTATHTPSGVTVTLARNFISNLIPIFQFGVFSNNLPLEFYPGPPYSFGGRVHTNSDIYLMAGTHLRFADKVTTVGHVVTSLARNGKLSGPTPFSDEVYIDDTAHNEVQLPSDKGSVIGGPDTDQNKSDIPDGVENNPAWGTQLALYGGTLKAKPDIVALRLPLDIPAANAGSDVEIIRRGRPDGDFEVEQGPVLNHPGTRVADSVNLAGTRLSNKPGLRITLADSKAKLPGCFGGLNPDSLGNPNAIEGPCGIRLDGRGDGLGADTGSRADANDGTVGYEPRQLASGTYATRFNGYRMYNYKSFTDQGMSPTRPKRQTWIKVEIVREPTGNQVPGSQITDITEEFLSLGLTHKDAARLNIGDEKAIIKMQRYELPGPELMVDASGNHVPTTVSSTRNFEQIDGTLDIASPVAGITGSSFSARWTGVVYAQETGNHLIEVERKGKVRVSIRPLLSEVYPETYLIDRWGDPLTTDDVRSDTYSMTLGQGYIIKVEYAGESASPKIKLRWRTPSMITAGDPSIIIPQPFLGRINSAPHYHPNPDPYYPAGDGLRGEYFDGSLDLNERPVYTNNGSYSYVLQNTNFNFVGEGATHAKASAVGQVIPFPIQMFDAREGLYNDDLTSIDTVYPMTVPWNGVMSMVDIDMANLKLFLDGAWDDEVWNHAAHGGDISGRVPVNNGVIVYISDRRGDKDFDGEFDMEDVYGTLTNPQNGGDEDPGEDINFNGFLDSDTEWEGSKYRTDLGWPNAVIPHLRHNTATANRDIAAFFDHRFFRRGIRLINGSVLPGTTTSGLTIASENGVYIYGNYNATGVEDHDDSPTPPTKYLGAQVPAAIMADAITVLSNAWVDGKSFRSPFDIDGRSAVTSETTVRVALMVGATISSQYFGYTPGSGGTLGTNTDPGETAPSQGGGNYRRLNGGVPNLIRMLEDWGGDSNYLNYCGSMIMMFNSRNNNGSFKYKNFHIYYAPTRNYVFDTSFLDTTRLPPGTPFVQHAQVTGFRVIGPGE